ncbi:hypothetical protein U1Q18_042337 [Sarracenia purpurea var. burkii]
MSPEFEIIAESVNHPTTISSAQSPMYTTCIFVRMPKDLRSSNGYLSNKGVPSSMVHEIDRDHTTIAFDVVFSCFIAAVIKKHHVAKYSRNVVYIGAVLPTY